MPLQSWITHMTFMEDLQSSNAHMSIVVVTIGRVESTSRMLCVSHSLTGDVHGNAAIEK